MYTRKQLEELKAEYYDRRDEARNLAAEYAEAKNLTEYYFHYGKALAFADAIDMLDELIDREDGK